MAASGLNGMSDFMIMLTILFGAIAAASIMGAIVASVQDPLCLICRSLWQTIRYQYESLQGQVQAYHASVARGQALPDVFRVTPGIRLRSPFKGQARDSADHDRLLDPSVPEASRMGSFTHLGGKGHGVDLC